MRILILLSFLFARSSYGASFYCTLDESAPGGFPQGVVEISKTHIEFSSGQFKTSTKISETTKNMEIMAGTNSTGHMTNFNRYTGELKLMVPSLYLYRCSKKTPLI